MKNKRLYLVDATAFCYRAFYALKGLATSFGQPTNAIYGFINMLNKILKEQKPDYLAVCFDVSRDTFRQKKFAEYKIQRPPMPEDLSSQMSLIKEIVSAYSIALLEKEGFEADDIIATLSKRAKEQGLSVTIISSDKDILQLVDKQTNVFNAYKDEGVTYDTKKVFERFGVMPEQIVDILALMGDEADNIPGLPGIGEKTAVELIKKFGSLKNLLNNLQQIDKEKIKNTIAENIEKINLNKELALLDKNVNIDFDLERLKVGKPKVKELFRLFKYLEFKSFLKELPAEEENPAEMKIQLCSDQDLANLIHTCEELFLYGRNLAELVFCAGGKFFRLDKPGVNLKALLSNPKVKKISHDFKKIKISLAKDNIPLEGLSFDLMLAAYLINPSRGEYGLREIAWDYLNCPVSKDIDNQQALDLLIKLKPRLEKELQDKSLFGLFRDIEMPLIGVLTDIELNGIKLDRKVLEGLSRDIEKRLVKLIEEIYDLSGCQFNINSPKQLRDILFLRLGLPVIKRSKTGPSTNEEVLRNLADKHKLPALLLEYRQLMKLKTTYIDTLPGLINPETERIHSSFNQTATETGRLSSTNPNLQNIPVKTDIGRQIRRAIIASEDKHCLLSCDYSQVELRILAHLSGDENLLSEFKQDKDIHKATASLIYGLEEKEISDSMREVGKRVNFGIVYGLTAYGLSRDLNISLDEAEGFIEAYFLRYPKVREYINRQIKKAQDDGFVTTILGRHRYLPEINNKNQGIRQFAERQAVNTPIQGSASDLIKLAMIQIHNWIKESRLKTKMILQIHDELLFDLPLEELKESAAEIKNKMESVLKLNAPLRVDVKSGKNWLEMKEVK